MSSPTDAAGGTGQQRVAARFWDAVNAGHLDQVASLVADDCTNFGSLTNGPEMIRRWGHLVGTPFLTCASRCNKNSLPETGSCIDY